MQLRTCTSLLAVFVLPAGLASAQGAPNGPSGALPLGLSLSGSSVNGTDATYVKPAGNSGQATPFLSPPSSTVPNYTLTALFPMYSDVIEVDAQSTGNGMILNAQPGSNPPHPNIQAGQAWLEMVASVTNDSQGLPGSLIAQRVALNNGRSTPGADLIGFFLEGSAGLDPSLPGSTRREVRAERLGLVADEELDAFDFGVGVLGLDTTLRRDFFFHRDDRFFFSLSPGCIQAVNQRAALLGTAFASGQPADPATVYEVQRSGNGWSSPQVYQTAAVLGLDPAVDNLDALEVDPVSENIIFSAQNGKPISQLRFLDYDSFSASPVVVLGDLGDGAGGLASARLGSNDETDDIDAVCIIDPEAGMRGNHLAVAVNTGPIKNPLGLAMARGVAKGGVNYHLQVTGFEEDSAGSGVVVFYGQLLPVGLLSGTVPAVLPLGAVARGAQQDLVDWKFPVKDNASGPVPSRVWAMFYPDKGGDKLHSWGCDIDLY